MCRAAPKTSGNMEIIVLLTVLMELMETTILVSV